MSDATGARSGRNYCGAAGSVEVEELGFVPVLTARGAKNPEHSHTLVEKMLIVQCGSGQIQIEGEFYELCASSVVVVPAAQFHALCNTGTDKLEDFPIFNRNVDRKKCRFEKLQTALQTGGGQRSAACRTAHVEKGQTQTEKVGQEAHAPVRR